jgi:hypothetical protein
MRSSAGVTIEVAGTGDERDGWRGRGLSVRYLDGQPWHVEVPPAMEEIVRDMPAEIVVEVWRRLRASESA